MADNPENNSEKIQKLRVKVAYLWGLGVGITVTALQLTPNTSRTGDKYMVSLIFGLIVLVVAGALTLYTRRKEITVKRRDNLADLLEKRK